MPRAAAKAVLAAAALEAFLRLRSPMAPLAREPDTSAADEAVDTAAGNDRVMPPPPRTIEPGAVALPSLRVETPLWLPHTDWLRHRLVVTGPAAELDAFRAAASGAGLIPWQLDLANLEEDWFHRLIHPAQRSLSLRGARMLAAQLREAVEHRHALAVARVGHSRACPLDLHALVPVAPEILALGPDHPDALSWLWEHWGTTAALRHVTVDFTEDDRSADEQVGPALRWHFWSADWTPWRAIARIRTEWSHLLFNVQPSYD